MNERISIGSHSVDGLKGEVWHNSVHIGLIRKQTLEVLKALSAASGQVISKDDLIAQVWPDTAVTDDSLVQCITELRKAVGPDRSALETVPRQGYRLLQTRAPAHPFDTASQVERIMVVPFHHSGDKEVGFVATGITLDLVEAISKGSDFSILGCSEDETDPLHAAKEAGATYLVEGMVRFSGDRVVVNASIRSVDTGEFVWSDRSTAPADSLFDIQDEITLGLARGIRETLDVETGRYSYGLLSGRTRSFEAWRLMSEATLIFGDVFFDPHQLDRVRYLLESALEHDPDLASAQIALAEVAYWEARGNGAPDLDKHLAIMNKLLLDNPNEPEAYMSRSKLRLFLEDWDGAEDDCRNAIRSAPNSALTMIEAGYTLNKVGLYEEVVWLNERAYELDPRREKTGNSLTYCIALYHLGRLDEADEAVTKLISHHRRYHFMKYYAAIIAFERGELSKANKLFREFKERTPTFGLADTVKNLRNRDPAQTQRVAATLTALEENWQGEQGLAHR